MGACEKIRKKIYMLLQKHVSKIPHAHKKVINSWTQSHMLTSSQNELVVDIQQPIRLSVKTKIKYF